MSAIQRWKLRQPDDGPLVVEGERLGPTPGNVIEVMPLSDHARILAERDEEIEWLRDANETKTYVNQCQGDRLRQAEAALEQVREALPLLCKRVEHEAGCGTETDQRAACTCGLDAALAALDAAGYGEGE